MSYPHTMHWRTVERVEQHVDFALLDAKGRAIGAVVQITPVQVTAGYDPRACGATSYGHCYGTSFACGAFWHVDVHATRDRVRFGALRRGHNCDSLEAARAKAEAMVRASLKRFELQARKAGRL